MNQNKFDTFSEKKTFKKIITAYQIKESDKRSSTLKTSLNKFSANFEIKSKTTNCFRP